MQNVCLFPSTFHGHDLLRIFLYPFLNVDNYIYMYVNDNVDDDNELHLLDKNLQTMLICKERVAAIKQSL